MFTKEPESPTLILETVARRAGVTAGVLLESRDKDVRAWKMIAIYLLRKAGHTVAKVGVMVSRDASTVSHAFTKINKQSGKKWFIDLSNSIEEELNKNKNKKAGSRTVAPYCQRIPMEVYAAAFAAADD
jgi:chromosomal replication initiation ATPase DnaA